VSTEQKIGHRLGDIRDRVNAASRDAGRDPSKVRLVAVSKTQPVEALEAAYRFGQRHFGENYAQELTSKASALAAAGLDDVRWHFIGRLQGNKIKQIAAHVSYVHALEKLSHARALATHAERTIRVMVAVNIAGEHQKSGVHPDAVLDRCAEIAELDGIEVCGLMCIPPRASEPEASAPHYARMAELASMGRARGLSLPELSMGMSGDFPVAIRHGATLIRVGSAIFGRRG